MIWENPDPIHNFFCKKYFCWISVKACISRQQKKHTWGSTSNYNQSKVNHTFTYPECAKCKQGKQILAAYRKFKQKGGQSEWRSLSITSVITKIDL